MPDGSSDPSLPQSYMAASAFQPHAGVAAQSAVWIVPCEHQRSSSPAQHPSNGTPAQVSATHWPPLHFVPGPQTPHAPPQTSSAASSARST